MTDERMPWLDTEHGDYTRWLRSIVGSKVLLSAIAATCVVIKDDEDGQSMLLLGRRSDNGKWSIPSGAKQPDESVAEAAARELKEETGLDAENLELFREYSGKKQIHQYSNGDEVAYTKIVYLTRTFSGEITCPDGENSEARFFRLDDLPENCSGSTRRIVADLKNAFSK